MRLVSFYCDVDDSSFYKDNSIRLRRQCNDLDVPNLIVEENFGENWIDNVRAKPYFLLKMMNFLEDDFFWLDVDCSINKKIDFQLLTDWMGDIRSDGCPHDYVHFIKNNDSNKNFLVKWINEINEQKRGSHTAFIRIYNSINFSKLPDGYVSLGVSHVESKLKYFKNEK